MSGDGYGALRDGAALADRRGLVRVIVGGGQAAEAMNGLLTNDVLALTPGTGLYAAALTPKGKIIADVRVFRRTDDLLLDTSAAAAPGFLAMLRKYLNPRLAKWADVTAVLGGIGIAGPRSRAVLAAVLGHTDPALSAFVAYQHHRFQFDGAAVDVARVPDFGVEGFDLFVPVEVAAALAARLSAAGAVPLDHEAAEVARVEAGLPLYGTDMGDDTLAQEANLDELHGISYTKGCYTGQETVARVHFRGHVNRHLRGLRSEVALPWGASLTGANGQPCGDVRSTVHSPRLGHLALAMLRREMETGANVTVNWAEGEAEAQVVSLPFAE